MNYRISISLLLFLSSLFMKLNAQTTDHGIWSSLGIEKKLGKWDLGVGAELRTKDNASQVDKWVVKFESLYNINKYIGIGAGYEYIYYHDTRYIDFQPRNRAYAVLQGKYKLGRFTFSLRERAQVTKKDDSDRIKKNGEINTYAINPEWIWRNRIKVAYNIPNFRVTPAFSLETFYQLNNPDGNDFCKLRYTLSFNYNITKRHQIEVFGLIDKEINVSDPVQIYVAGVGYEYSF